MTYCIRFSAELEQATNEHVRLAQKIWKDAKADPSVPVRVAAGNYAGYGKYVARCHSSGVIEFPIGNKFSVLQLVGNEITFRGSKKLFLGTLLHEIGHHVVNTATTKPWLKLRDGGSSTHLRREWIWICVTGWSHFHDSVPSHQSIVATLRSTDRKLRERMVDALTRFSPYTPPPRLKQHQVVVCGYCEASLDGKRMGAKYCSTSCRVMASRERRSR